MRLYFGSTALLLAVGFACGCVAGWWLTRLYFVRVLRGIQRRLRAFEAGAIRCGPIRASVNGVDIGTVSNVETVELRRRKP